MTNKTSARYAKYIKHTKLHIAYGVRLRNSLSRNLHFVLHGLPISESCGGIGPEKLFSDKLRVRSFRNRRNSGEIVPDKPLRWRLIPLMRKFLSQLIPYHSQGYGSSACQALKTPRGSDIELLKSNRAHPSSVTMAPTTSTLASNQNRATRTAVCWIWKQLPHLYTCAVIVMTARL